MKKLMMATLMMTASTAMFAQAQGRVRVEGSWGNGAGGVSGYGSYHEPEPVYAPPPPPPPQYDDRQQQYYPDRDRYQDRDGDYRYNNDRYNDRDRDRDRDRNYYGRDRGWGHAYGARPACPGPEFVWIDGYYDYYGGRGYNWRAGYWSRRPYARAEWVRPNYRGGRYFAGYWRR